MTRSETGIDTQARKFSCCAQYRKDSSADTSLSSRTCLYLRKRVSPHAIFTGENLRYKIDSVQSLA